MIFLRWTGSKCRRRTLTWHMASVILKVSAQGHSDLSLTQHAQPETLQGLFVEPNQSHSASCPVECGDLVARRMQLATGL